MTTPDPIIAAREAMERATSVVFRRDLAADAIPQPAGSLTTGEAEAFRAGVQAGIAWAAQGDFLRGARWAWTWDGKGKPR